MNSLYVNIDFLLKNYLKTSVVLNNLKKFIGIFFRKIKSERNFIRIEIIK